MIAASLLAALALAAAPGSGTEAVTLRSPPALRAGVDAFPRIAAPTGEPERRINAAVARLDDKVRAAIKACLSDGGREADWARQIDTPMRGPEFLSYVIGDDVDCGGAHPDSGHTAIVYDLRTGAPVDWTRLLPATLTGALALATGADDVRMVTLASPRLFALYRRGYDAGPADPDEKECRDAIASQGESGPVPMFAWLDAKEGGLALQFDLSHAEQACSEPVVIPIETLRKEGASPRLLAALQAAHAAAAKAPQPHKR